MTSLMTTMTDVFYAIGDFSQMVFKGMRSLGHGPNIVLWIIIGVLLAYWTRYCSQNKLFTSVFLYNHCLFGKYKNGYSTQFNCQFVYFTSDVLFN